MSGLRDHSLPLHGWRNQILKPQGKVLVEANLPLRTEKTPRSRIFNLVPGFEAVPIIAELPSDEALECRIRVGSS